MTIMYDKMQSSLISREMSTIPIWKIRKLQCREVKSLALYFKTSIWWHGDWFQFWQYPNLCISTFPWQLCESFTFCIHTNLSEASWSLTPMRYAVVWRRGIARRAIFIWERIFADPVFIRMGYVCPEPAAFIDR